MTRHLATSGNKVPHLRQHTEVGEHRHVVLQSTLFDNHVEDLAVLFGGVVTAGNLGADLLHPILAEFVAVGRPYSQLQGCSVGELVVTQFLPLILRIVVVDQTSQLFQEEITKSVPLLTRVFLDSIEVFVVAGKKFLISVIHHVAFPILRVFSFSLLCIDRFAKRFFVTGSFRLEFFLCLLLSHIRVSNLVEISSLVSEVLEMRVHIILFKSHVFQALLEFCKLTVSFILEESLEHLGRRILNSILPLVFVDVFLGEVVNILDKFDFDR